MKYQHKTPIHWQTDLSYNECSRLLTVCLYHTQLGIVMTHNFLKKSKELGSLTNKLGLISEIDENPTMYSTKCYILQITYI